MDPTAVCMSKTSKGKRKGWKPRQPSSGRSGRSNRPTACTQPRANTAGHRPKRADAEKHCKPNAQMMKKNVFSVPASAADDISQFRALERSPTFNTGWRKVQDAISSRIYARIRRRYDEPAGGSSCLSLVVAVAAASVPAAAGFALSGSLALVIGGEEVEEGGDVAPVGSPEASNPARALPACQRETWGTNKEHT